MAADQKNVLILNDDDAVLISFKVMLKPQGFNLHIATSMKAALDLFKNNKIDVVISDLNLGDGEPDGYDFLKAVRELDKTLPFYMVSGCSSIDEKPKAMKLGANGYLQLPVNKEQLLEVIL